MKINFTQEHFRRMQALLMQMLLNNEAVSTAMGAPLNVVELLHTTTINTLNKIRVHLSIQVRNLENADEWVATESTQIKLDNLKMQKELVNLIIGYKRFQLEAEELTKKKEELKAKIAEMKEADETPNWMMRSKVAKVKATPFVDPHKSFYDNYLSIKAFCNGVFQSGGTNISAIPEGLHIACKKNPQILDALKSYPVWTIISDGEWNNLRSPEASMNDFMRKCENYFGFRPFIVAIDINNSRYGMSSNISSVRAEQFSGIDNFMYIPSNPAQIEQFLTNFKDMDVFDAYTPLATFKNFFNVETAKYSWNLKVKTIYDSEDEEDGEYTVEKFKKDLNRVGKKEKNDDDKEYVVREYHIGVNSRKANTSTNIAFMQVGDMFGSFGSITKAINEDSILVTEDDYGCKYFIKVLNIESKPSLYRGELLY
jgi:hypothetical protein